MYLKRLDIEEVPNEHKCYNFILWPSSTLFIIYAHMSHFSAELSLIFSSAITLLVGFSQTIG